MYIYATKTLPNSSVGTVHRLVKTEMTDTCHATISSFASADAAMLVWQDTYILPNDVLASGSYPTNVLNWLISSTGPFFGGTLESDPTTLDADKTRLTNAITAMRDTKISGGVLVTISDGPPVVQGVVDTDDISIRNIMGSCQVAMISITNNQPFSIDWRMHDNSTVTLTAAEMLSVGIQVMQHTNDCYTYSWTLKAQVDAATADTIGSINYLTGWP